MLTDFQKELVKPNPKPKYLIYMQIGGYFPTVATITSLLINNQTLITYSLILLIIQTGLALLACLLSIIGMFMLKQHETNPTESTHQYAIMGAKQSSDYTITGGIINYLFKTAIISLLLTHDCPYTAAYFTLNFLTQIVISEIGRKQVRQYISKLNEENIDYYSGKETT